MFSHNSQDIRPAFGARTSSKRLGRGNSSGKGGTSGKGGKGQTARAGAKFHPTFEGGQTPLFRRAPKKRGFNRGMLQTNFAVVNLAALEALGLEQVSYELLVERGIIRAGYPVKLLGNGTLTKKLTVRVHAVSASARAAVEQSGGTVELITE